jgi:histone H3/H4
MEGSPRPHPNSAFTGGCWQTLLSDLVSGERLSPEAETMLNALGQDLLSKLAIQACEAARRRRSPTIMQDDVKFAFETVFCRSDQREPERRAPSTNHEERMQLLRRFQESQEAPPSIGPRSRIVQNP